MAELHPIALIGCHLKAARTDIIHDYNVIQFGSERRGVVEIDGTETPFVIVTIPEQLLGIAISGYQFLPSACILSGMQRHEMELIAKSRIRP